MARTLGTAIIPIRAVLDQLDKDLDRARDSVDKRLGGMSRHFDKLGRQLTVGLTVPIVGIGVAAVASSIQFESAFAGVEKTVNASEQELAKLRQGIRDMAKEVPATREEIAGVAEAAGQLGIQTPNILKFTRTMVDLGESTNLSATDAATALARLANITQLPQTEFDRLGSTVVALGNNFATTESEIVEMSLRIAGAGKQVGLTEAEILSFAAALSSVGIEAQAGGSAISRVMIDIQSAVAGGGEELEQFARVAGMSADQFRTKFQTDAAGAIVAFITGLRRIGDEGGNVTGTLDSLGLSELRVRDALLRAAGAGDLFSDAIKLGSEAWRENTALTDEAAKRYETTEARLEIMRNRLTDVALTLGDALVPMLMAALSAGEPFLDVLAKLAEGFAGLPQPVQMVIVGFFGLVAAIGPVLMITAKLITAWQTLRATNLASTIAGASGQLGSMAATIGRVAGPAAIAVTAVLGVKTAIEALGFGARALTVDMEAFGQASSQSLQNLAAEIIAVEDKTGKFGVTVESVFDKILSESEGQALRFIEALKAQGYETDALEGKIRAKATADAVGKQAGDQYGAMVDEVTSKLAGQKQTTGELAEATQQLHDVLLAATGGELGYQQAIINVEKAQRTLDEAIREHGPASAEARDATLSLEQAKLSAAKAAITLHDDTSRLTDATRTNTAAIDDEIARLEQVAAQYPESAESIRPLIQRLQDLKGSIDALPPETVTRVDADTASAETKLDRVRAKLREISATYIAGGGSGHGEVYVPHAAGGIFRTPHLGLVAEAGPEAILPLNDPARSWDLIARAGLLDWVPAMPSIGDTPLTGSATPGGSGDVNFWAPIHIELPNVQGGRAAAEELMRSLRRMAEAA